MAVGISVPSPQAIQGLAHYIHGCRAAQDQYVGPGEQRGDGRGRLPPCAPDGRVAPGRVLVRGLAALPGLGAIAQHGHLEHGVAGQCGQADALVDGIGIFQAHAQRGHERVDDDLVLLDPVIGEEDDDLLGQVDVQVGEGDYGVPVGHGRGGGRLVCPLLRLAQQQTLLRRDVAHRLQDLGVLLLLAATVDYQRGPGRFQDLLYGGRGLLGRGVLLLWVGRDQAQADEVGAPIDPGLGPERRVIDRVAELDLDRQG